MLFAVDLVRKVPCGLVGLLVLPLVLEELDDLVLVDVHDGFLSAVRADA
jgi:hypothetical protein